MMFVHIATMPSAHTPNASTHRRWWAHLLCLGALMLGACQPSGDSAAPVTGSGDAPRVNQASEVAGGFQGIDLTGANYGQTLGLPDTTGRVRELSEFKGQVVVVFFGYTQCPDVCPTTLLELARAKQALGADLAAKVQGVFVTVDPARDTPEVLQAYVQGMDPTLVALRGTEAQTRALAQSFKVYYNPVPGAASGAYTMDHTAGVYLIDPLGRLRVFQRYGAGPQALAADLRRLLSGA